MCSPIVALLALNPAAALVRHPDHTAEFVPHLVDDNSGGSTEIVAQDVNNDHHPAILISNKRGTFLFVQDAAAK